MDDDDDRGLGECHCPFRPERRRSRFDSSNNLNSSNNNNINGIDSNKEVALQEESVYRGQRGPGLWHCYVAIIDGNDTSIRIDGQPERVTAPWGGLCPVLDGLTIGSDHAFDMSLCYGQGSHEEGEGAIAELAVFRGRLPLADVCRIEDSLMDKHGLSPAPPGSQFFFAQEDESKRQARALLAQTRPPYGMTGPPVPLRIVARDSSVAWQRTNAVTGATIYVRRIGSKSSTGSSDW